MWRERPPLVRPGSRQDRTATVDVPPLLVFKAMVNRTRDWAEIESILDACAVDGRVALTSPRALLGDSDPAVDRLAGLTRHGEIA
jgi:hypothetical protein